MALLEDWDENFRRIEREKEAQDQNVIILEGDLHISVCYVGKTNMVEVDQTRCGKRCGLSLSIDSARIVHRLLGELLQRDTD
jgi:hypothetical protein